MRFLVSRPAVLLLVAWVGGILAGDHAVLSARTWATGALLLLAVALMTHRTRAPLLVTLVLGLLALAAAGAARLRLAVTPPPTDISRWVGRQISLTGTVIGEPAGDERGQRFLLAAEVARVAGVAHRVTGRAHIQAPPAPLSIGERVEVSGVPRRPLPAPNPGGFSAVNWLRVRDCFTTLRSPILLRRGQGRLPWWRDRPLRWRRTLTGANRALWEQTLARRGVPAATRGELVALVNAVALGNPEHPESEWTALRDRFRGAGILHVLVVSGAQVALLIWLLPLLCVPLGLGTRASSALTLGTIWLYAAICGLEAPILRAALMGSFYLVGRMVAREAVTENSLALAAFVMLLAWPLSLYDVGFQLSFLAVWGLIALTGPLEAALRPLLPGWGGAGRSTHPLVLRLRERQCDPLTWLAAAVGAQLFTAGVIAQSFQRLYLAGFGANLLAVPLAAAILLLALPMTLFNAAWQGLDLPILPPGPLNWGNELLLGTARVLERVAGFFATRGWSWVNVFPPGWPAVVLSLAGLVLAGKWLGQARQTTVDCQPRRVDRRVEGPIRVLRHALGCGRRQSAALTSLASLLVLTVAMFLPARPPGVVELIFFDVGQGDCCLARFPNGGTLLVDGGGAPFSDFDVGERIVAPALRALRINRLDLIALSHGHEDHVGGLPSVLRQFRVGRVLEAGGPVDAESYALFRALIRERGIALTQARRGTRLLLGPALRRRAPAILSRTEPPLPGDLTLIELLHPPGDLLAGTRSDVNNNSLVLRVTHGSVRLLFAGDAEAAAEASMRGVDLRAEVLKVGHHGSATSTSEEWLAAVRPRLAVVSCGRHNRFGHPHRQTLDRLERHGVSLLRTDLDGAVTVTLRGGRIEARGTLPVAPALLLTAAGRGQQ